MAQRSSGPVPPRVARPGIARAGTARAGAAPDPRPERFRQGSLADLGAPLVDATFVVVDLETTGGSPRTDAITEVGAVKVRGGEVLGTFQTMVNPGRAIPPTITVLTGITESMVATAPRIEPVLASLLEFMGDAVVVGHNVRFDVGFLQAALERARRPPLTGPTIDTVALARRLVRDEVPDCKLATLADRFRLSHQPSHRALDDALSTADLLHLLLERAGRLGVTGLDDLIALPSMAGHPQADKLRLTERLPRRPGVYLFRAKDGRVLYVGKATNLRSRVRSYFSTDERRKIGSLLRETARIDHKVCPSTLEASVLEARLIRTLEPRYNAHGTRWRRYPYLKLTLDEAFPRLSVVRTVRDDGGLYLGPLRSAQQAKAVAEAIESVVPLRRCTQAVRRRTALTTNPPNDPAAPSDPAAASDPKPPSEPTTPLAPNPPKAVNTAAADGARSALQPSRMAPCASGQLGVALCPCAGGISEADYDVHVQRVVSALTGRADLLVGPLQARMDDMARAERFEEAAAARDRLDALITAIGRQRRMEQLIACERLLVRVDSGEVAELRRGVLWQMWPEDHAEQLTAVARSVEMQPCNLPTPGRPVDRDLADELACVGSWLDQHTSRLRLEHVDGRFASVYPHLPDVRPHNSRSVRRLTSRSR